LAKDLGTKSFSFRGDTALNAYILAWGQHALLNDPLNIFNASFLYPTPNTITLNDNLFAVAFLGLPLRVFDNPLIVINVMFMAGMFGTAMTWYWVLRRWRLGLLAAFLGGFAVGFMPWRFGHLGHANLQFTWWLPLVIYFVERWVREAGWRPALAAAACLACSFYSGVYHTFFLMQFLIPFGITGLCAYAGKRGWIQRGMQVVGAGAFFALLLSPALGPYYRTKAALNDPNRLESISGSSGELSDYIRPCFSNIIWGEVLRPETRKDAVTPWEQANFIGLGLTVLGLVGLVSALACPGRGAAVQEGNPSSQRPRALALMLLAGGIWLFLLSFGPYLHWNGERTDYRMPHWLVFNYFPGAQAIRVPSRASFMVAFALSGMAAMAVHRLWGLRPGIPRVAGRLIAMSVGALLMLECVHRMDDVSGSELYQRHLSLHRKIAEMRRGPSLVLPLSDELNYFVGLTTYPHFYPTLNGLTGYLPPDNARIFTIFRSARWGDAQAKILRDFRVRYIISDLRAKGFSVAAPNRMIENFLRDHGFLYERSFHPEAQLTLFRIDPDFEEFALNHHLVRTGSQFELHVTLQKIGRVMEVPRNARWCSVRARAYDEKDECIWKQTVEFELPATWMPGQKVDQVLRITGPEAENIVEMKFRVEQEELGYKVEVKFDL